MYRITKSILSFNGKLKIKKRFTMSSVTITDKETITSLRNIIYDHLLSGDAVRLYFMIYDFFQTNVCQLSHGHLSKLSGYKPHTLKKSLDSLFDLGYIDKIMDRNIFFYQLSQN